MKSELEGEGLRGGLKMYQAKSGENQGTKSRGGGGKLKVAQNGLQHILVWAFCKSDVNRKFYVAVHTHRQTENQPTRWTDTTVTS